MLRILPTRTGSTYSLTLRHGTLTLANPDPGCCSGASANLPADLPRETRRITPTESVCPKCGGDLKVISETVSEQLEIIRSAFKVIETVHPKLACSRCDVIVLAPLPSTMR